MLCNICSNCLLYTSLEKVNESRFLLSCHGVARLALLIEPSLIADADRASMIRSGMSTNLQQHPVLRHRSILTDVEVVADVIKPTSLMVTSQPVSYTHLIRIMQVE